MNALAAERFRRNLRKFACFAREARQSIDRIAGVASWDSNPRASS